MPREFSKWRWRQGRARVRVRQGVHRHRGLGLWGMPRQHLLPNYRRGCAGLSSKQRVRCGVHGCATMHVQRRVLQPPGVHERARGP